uniref:Tripartite motif-containing protein 45-like n=1 Tax=Saccoglossus kowalevskii TaxID=10224 RepID=A0ABM0GV17_SACKO|nr:PREDICTED: tripartite motif-containing protein 45-like [Saccoglossus kowalevskii]
MAASKPYQLVEELDEDLLNCEICSDRYTNAKLLPCQHSFCEDCLVTMVSRSGLPGVVICPLCRRKHDIPGGISNVENNMFINQLVEVFNVRDENTCQPIKCTACAESEVIKRCLDCAMDVCDNCARAHTKFPVTRNHTIITLEEYKSDKTGQLHSAVYCDKHPDNQIKLYCDTCEVAICLECTVIDHHHHHCKYLDNAASEFKEKLSVMVKEMKVKEKEGRQSIVSVQKVSDSLESNFKQEESKLCQFVEKMMEETSRKIRDNGATLMKEIEDVHKVMQSNLKAQLKQLETSTSDLTRTREFAENLLTHGNASHLMSAKKSMSSELPRLLEMCIIQEPKESDYIKFCPSQKVNQTADIGVISTHHCLGIHSHPNIVRIQDDVIVTMGNKLKIKEPITLDCIQAALKTPSDKPVNMTIKNSHDGSVEFKFKAENVGDYELSVSSYNKPVMGSPVSINVIPRKGLICNFGRNSPGLGKLSYPFGVALTKKRNILVCDSASKKIQL